LKDFCDTLRKCADSQEFSPGTKLDGLIRRAHQKTGKQVVVIIDEYDGPLLDVIHDTPLLDSVRREMQEFYQPLKANERVDMVVWMPGKW
jgi:hypothetical protein